MRFNVFYSSSKGNLYTVEAEDGSLLIIDPGVHYSRIHQKINLRKVKGCLVSHSHLDHCKAVPKLVKRGIYCYMSPQTIKAIGVESFYAHPIFGNYNNLINPFIVTPFDVKHDAPGCYGFLINSKVSKETLIYVTDTPYLENIASLNKLSLHIIAIECNYSDDAFTLMNPELEIRIRNNHMGLDAVLSFLKKQNLQDTREIFLLHLSEKNSNRERFIQKVQQQTGLPVFA